MKTFENFRIFLLGIGMILSAAVIKWLLLPLAVNIRISKELPLREGTEALERWKVVPVPIVMKVYLFNVTNPDEIFRGGKPHFTEVGPYVYEERCENVVEEIREESDSILYRPRTTYYFREDLSVGREDDVYTFLNILLVSIVNSAMRMPPQIRYFIKELMDEQEEELFLKLKVGEYLFSGYQDEMVKALSELEGKEYLPNGTFSIYGAFNGTKGELLEIYSGVKDLSKLGETKSWDGRQKHNTWSSSQCNTVDGTDGITRPPFITRDRVVRIFKPEMCRSMHMTYERDEEVEGVEGFRFVFGRDVLEGATENPGNECYCIDPQENNEGCYPSGVFDLSPCVNGSIAVSWPHFYNGDPSYLNQSVGLNPNKELHGSYMILEPFTGAPMKANARVQMNSALKRNKYFKLFKNVPTMLFPIFWTDEGAAIDDEIGSTLRWQLVLPMQLVSILVWTLVGIGTVVVLYALLWSKPYFLLKKEKGTRRVLSRAGMH